MAGLIRSPVKKSKVGISSWLFLTHPLFPSLFWRGDNSLQDKPFPSLGERGMQGGEFKKRNEQNSGFSPDFLEAR
jgi:hypothetical protein